MNNNDEEVLGFIDRLVERLQQAGHTDQGGKIEVVYVASGGQHVETQIIASPGLTPTPSPRGEGNLKWRGGGKAEGNLPDVLATEEAMVLWEKVRAAGYVDEHFQPKISRTQAALLADAMAGRLGITQKQSTVSLGRAFVAQGEGDTDVTDVF